MCIRANAPLQSKSKPAHISIENIYDINVDDETAQAQSAIPWQLTVYKSMFNKFQGFLFCNASNTQLCFTVRVECNTANSNLDELTVDGVEFYRWS